MGTPELLTLDELRREFPKIFNVSEETIWRWRNRNRHPLPSRKFGKQVLYPRSEIEQWIDGS